MNRFFSLALAAALASCGDQAAAPDNAATETETAVPETPAAPAPANTADTSIPGGMIGRWGMTAADCTSTKGDAKGLMTIAPTGVSFYESRAVAGSVTERTPTRLVGDFDFSGEGMEWKRTLTLELGADGRTITRHEAGEDASPDTFSYTRCESQG